PSASTNPAPAATAARPTSSTDPRRHPLMRRLLPSRSAGMLVLLGLLVAGCGRSGPPRYELSGPGAYAGKPLPAGVIFFDPAVRGAKDGPRGFATVREGGYDPGQKGKGSVGGPHRVRIQGFDGQPGPELPLGQPLFPEYQTDHDLPKENSTRDFEIPAT